jgi:hypothetical protein
MVDPIKLGQGTVPGSVSTKAKMAHKIKKPKNLLLKQQDVFPTRKTFMKIEKYFMEEKK